MTRHPRPSAARDFRFRTGPDGQVGPGAPGMLYWYDGPLLAIGESSSGQTMLAMAVEDDDLGNPRYLITPISYRRLQALLSNAITLRQVFRRSEFETLLLWWFDSEIGEWRFDVMRHDSVDSTMLSTRRTRCRPSGRPARIPRRRSTRLVATRHPETGQLVHVEPDHRKSRATDRSGCILVEGRWYRIRPAA